MSVEALETRKAIALDLARCATDLQCAIAGRTNVRETDHPLGPRELCARIIEKAEQLEDAPEGPHLWTAEAGILTLLAKTAGI